MSEQIYKLKEWREYHKHRAWILVANKITFQKWWYKRSKEKRRANKILREYLQGD